MPLHLMDALAARRNGKSPETADSPSRPERRHRRRLPVRWPVTVCRDDGSQAIATITRDLSSAGFYCLIPVPLTPGERLRCTVGLPAYDPQSEQRHIALDCKAVVVRAEAAADGFYGVAFHIDEYHLSGGAAN